MYAKNKTSAYRNTDLKKFAAAITCMVLLFVLLFSITYISLDCCGEDCHICECLEACGKTLSLIRCDREGRCRKFGNIPCKCIILYR